MIQKGRLSIDGVVVADPSTELAITDGQAFLVAGQRWQYHGKAYLMLNKPAGCECSRRPLHHPSVFSLLPAPLCRRDVQCIGRLDQDTTGLLLLSDDGQFIHRWSSGKKSLPKTYRVTLCHPISAELPVALVEGVRLRDETTDIRASACEIIDDHRLRLTITAGKYHQVKRMIAAAGNRVDALQRIAIGGLCLPENLPVGQWCWLKEADFAALNDF